MRNVFAALVVLSTLSGCVALQQMSQSAANNAKPASAPVLTEHPSSSALWKDAPTTFHVGARSFALNVTSDLFNTVSVKLGGRQAVELPRGSFTDYRPIDRSQLAHGNLGTSFIYNTSVSGLIGHRLGAEHDRVVPGLHALAANGGHRVVGRLAARLVGELG